MTQTLPVSLIAQIPLFSVATPAQLRRVLKQSQKLTFAAGEMLFQRGMPAQWVYIVLTGLVRVYQALDDHRQVTITHLGARSHFGEMDILGAEPNSSNGPFYRECAQAIRTTELLMLPAGDFENYIDANAQAANLLLRDMSRRFCLSADRELTLFYELPIRFASLLLTYADIAGVRTAAGVQIKMPLQQRDLAQALGVTTKSIARQYAVWRQMGLVRIHKGWWVICNSCELDAICNGMRFTQMTR